VTRSGGRIRGLVATGRREAAGFLEVPWVGSWLEGLLRAEPYPGTLNLTLRDDSAMDSWRALQASTRGLALAPEEEGFCAATVFPVRVDGRIPGAVVLPHVEDYPEDAIEIVASVGLRDALGLVDGASLEVSWGSSAVKDLQLEVCLAGAVESSFSAGFERFELIGDLPDMRFDEIDTSTTLFGRRLELPLFISSMTGGGVLSSSYNERLAQVAQQAGIGMAVGSQRLMLDDPALAPDFQVRKWAPDVLLLADLGLVHLNHGLDRDLCLRAVEEIEADALMFYVNPLHEALQAGGDLDFRGLLEQLESVAEGFPYPIVLKEVGSGFPEAALRRFAELSVAGVDVAGRGGTDWGRVEAIMAGRAPDGPLEELGVATAESLESATRLLPDVMVVLASGGIRDGVQIAKSLALGAAAAGMALPFLRWVHRSVEHGASNVARVHRELRVAMWYAGATDVEALRGRVRRIEALG
jgi:isopentenyl-diphosphate delta-isomerase